MVVATVLVLIQVSPHLVGQGALLDDDFAPILEGSPFLRTVAPSSSLVLTGMARIDSKVYVTVVDTETRETHLVTREANEEGWQLVDFTRSDTSPDRLRATIQLGQGEVVAIRYGSVPPVSNRGRGGHSGSGQKGLRPPAPLPKEHLAEARHAARNYREGFSADGYPAAPPPDMIQKLQRLSSQQRENINQEMLTLRNRGLGADPRKKIYIEKVDQALRGR